MGYITIIKYATFIFPLVAFLFTIPFMLVEYHKYGSISPLKTIITYLFVYYLLCAYFLVILPLPKISEVAVLTTPRTQFVPFHFILDFVKHSSFDITSPNTYLLAFKESYFYVPIFNIVLTIPFGMFLRYYFKCDKKKVIFFSFLLSLFFELTQLSGLYFIYPRGYRLFDVDDLILNTFGGFVGYFLSSPITYFVPKMDEVNEKAKQRGRVISGFRRMTTFLLDLFLFMTIELLVNVFFTDNIYLFIVIAVIYYILIPFSLNTATLAQKFLNIEILDYKNKRNKARLLFRKLWAIFFYILIPYGICYIIFKAPDNLIRELIGLIVIGFLFLMYFISSLKYVFTSKDMLYEKITKTKLVSTIK